jgi:hypothetical protein
MAIKQKELFEDGLDEYPLGTVVIENLFMVLWLMIGTYLCWLLKPVVAWGYLVFGLVMVLAVMRVLVCRNCYYHGKRCHTGWGKVSALYCNQGEISGFGCGVGGAIIPVFYGSIALVPLVLGVISTVKDFSLIKIGVLVGFLVIVIMSSVTLRKKSCGVCKMKGVCPGSV